MKIIANNYKPNEIIKIIREWSGKTQVEYAQILKKSKDTMQSYELGRIPIKLDQLMEIEKKKI